MGKWKPIPKDDRKEKLDRGLRIFCAAIAVVMATWTVCLAGQTITEALADAIPQPETAALPEPSDKAVPEQEVKPETDILQTAVPPAKTSEKKESSPKEEEPAVKTDTQAEPEDSPQLAEQAEKAVEEPIWEPDAEIAENAEMATDVTVQSDYAEEEPEACEPDIPEEAGSWDMYSADDLMFQGEIYQDGQRYTWYSQNVLPGGGLDIPGRHVDEEGYVVDGDGNVVIASGELEYGEIVYIPFGSGVGKVYDYCETPDTIDVYTDF